MADREAERRYNFSLLSGGSEAGEAGGSRRFAEVENDREQAYQRQRYYEERRHMSDDPTSGHRHTLPSSSIPMLNTPLTASTPTAPTYASHWNASIPSTVSPPITSNAPYARFAAPPPLEDPSTANPSQPQHWLSGNPSPSQPTFPSNGRSIGSFGSASVSAVSGLYHSSASTSRSLPSSSVSPQTAQLQPVRHHSHESRDPAPSPLAITANSIALPSTQQVHDYLVSHMAQPKGLDTDWRIAGSKFDVYVLFGTVIRAGGSTTVTTRKWWPMIGSLLGLPLEKDDLLVAQQLKTFFLKMLGGLEILWERTKTGEDRLVSPPTRAPLPTPMTATMSESGAESSHTRERLGGNHVHVQEQSPRQGSHRSSLGPSSASSSRPSWVTASGPAQSQSYTNSRQAGSSLSKPEPPLSSSSSSAPDVYRDSRPRQSTSSAALAPITSKTPPPHPLHQPTPIHPPAHRLPEFLGQRGEAAPPQQQSDSHHSAQINSASVPSTSAGPSSQPFHGSPLTEERRSSTSERPPIQLTFAGQKLGEYVVPTVSSFQELVSSNILPLPRLNRDVGAGLGPWTGDPLTVYSKRCHELGHLMNKIQKGTVDPSKPVSGEEIVFWAKLLAIMRRNPTVIPPKVEDHSVSSKSPLQQPAPRNGPLPSSSSAANGYAPGSFENPMTYAPPPNLLSALESTPPIISADSSTPKKRGRKKGSKNKPKPSQVPEQSTPVPAASQQENLNSSLALVLAADISKSSTPAADILRMLQGEGRGMNDGSPSAPPPSLQAALAATDVQTQQKPVPEVVSISPAKGTPARKDRRFGSVIPSSQDLSPSKKRIDLSGSKTSVAHLRQYDNTPTRFVPGGSQLSPLVLSQRSDNGNEQSPSASHKKKRGPRGPYKKTKSLAPEAAGDDHPQVEETAIDMSQVALPAEEVQTLAQAIVAQMGPQQGREQEQTDAILAVMDGEPGEIVLQAAEEPSALNGQASSLVRSPSVALTPRKRVEPVIELPMSRTKKSKVVRAPVDRAKVVIPIRKRRREELIRRGCYDAFRDDDSEDEVVQKRRVHVSLRPMKITLPRGTHAHTVRPKDPEQIPLRFLYRPGPGLLEPYASILTEHSLLRRCSEHECGWKGCDAVLGSEELLRRHVEVRGHAKQGRLQAGVSHWVFSDRRRTMETQLIPGEWLYRCFWKGCEEPCFNTEEKLVQHMLARHISRVLHCPYEDCDLVSPTISHLTRHVLKTHDEPTDIPRPLADLSTNLPPPPAPPPLPEIVRTDELTTPLVIGSSYRSLAQIERLRYKIRTHCFAGDDPVIHVEHPPHMLEKVETDTPLTGLEEVISVASDEEVSQVPRVHGEKRLLDQVLGRKSGNGSGKKRQRWELVVELPMRKRSKLGQGDNEVISVVD
ncbi:hypothetical protein CI109_106575 [Kwoniella shandongensis]|uniref:Uncharacterized protein n=1 Tax=Kwoniella shandongensis TaxID=1734106 RepID=A0A5M6C745_9TREE|nr:uncharacterized protein CI109_002757 [Kwoniella shandongensis]KAA5528999.1 hypothetical protein CI109_002757 [Kwoniella shandongensis]